VSVKLIPGLPAGILGQAESWRLVVLLSCFWSLIVSKQADINGFGRFYGLTPSDALNGLAAIKPGIGFSKSDSPHLHFVTDTVMLREKPYSAFCALPPSPAPLISTGGIQGARPLSQKERTYV